MKAGRPFTVVSVSLLNMGEWAFNSFCAIGHQLPDCVAGHVSYGSVNRPLFSSPHVAGVATAILASPDADVGFVGLAGGTLVRNIRVVVPFIVYKHRVIVFMQEGFDPLQ